jgi:hypothetical protein
LATVVLFADAQTPQVQLQRLVLPALLLINNPKIAQRPRFPHSITRALRDLQAAANTFESLVALSHCLVGGADTDKGTGLSNGDVQFRKKLMAPLVIADCLIVIAKVLVDSPDQRAAPADAPLVVVLFGSMQRLESFCESLVVVAESPLDEPDHGTGMSFALAVGDFLEKPQRFE